ncbi:hypothetical protein TcasGA2_TC006012 [Tribolium castaneum]|uniref:Uncharacterized protein n=1 Tax=Tribolium castaneum TaxID=7070 RepID=D6WUK3_TRICA|nr:hypothetical protein TcasGA2_TC006012 [Tribolium castaneum]
MPHRTIHQTTSLISGMCPGDDACVKPKRRIRHLPSSKHDRRYIERRCSRLILPSIRFIVRDVIVMQKNERIHHFAQG